MDIIFSVVTLTRMFCFDVTSMLDSNPSSFFHSFHSKTHSDCFSTQMSTGGAVSQTIYQLGERIEHRGSLIFGELSLEPPLTSPPTLQTS